jgi:cytochrome P450
MHEIFVPKNTNVMAGLVAANRNAALWGEDAREWKPERWLSKLPQPLLDARIPGVYSNLMTFVGGSRACMSVSRNPRLPEISV